MSQTIDTNSPSVHAHLNILQGLINRMSGNSANCKGLCTTLVSIIGAISYAAKAPGGMWISVLPILLFGYLDAMYLSLEQGFRKTYDEFVKNLHEAKMTEDQIFKVTPPPGYGKLPAILKAAKSWSVWPIYVSILFLALLIMAFIPVTHRGFGV